MQIKKRAVLLDAPSLSAMLVVVVGERAVHCHTEHLFQATVRFQMSSPTLSSDDEDETNGLEVLSEGIASTVYLGKQEDGHYFVVKNASTIKKFAPEPHDIVKELRILEILRQHRHSNVSLFILLSTYLRLFSSFHSMTLGKNPRR